MNDSESKATWKALTDMQYQITQLTDMYKELSVIIARFEDRHIDNVKSIEKLFAMLGSARHALAINEKTLKHLIDNTQYKFIS